MSMLRPTGGYFDQLLEPGGWPEIDEDAFYERAQEFTQVLRQVTEVLESCQQRRTQVFDDGVWSGGAADAANGELGTNIGHLMTLQNDLATAITWHKYVAGLVVQAKLAIDTNAEVAHQQILVLQNEPGLTAAERAIAIESLVVATHGANVAVVAGTTEQILASRTWTPPPRVMRWKTCSTSGHRHRPHPRSAVTFRPGSRSSKNRRRRRLHNRCRSPR